VSQAASAVDADAPTGEVDAHDGAVLAVQTTPSVTGALRS
jgi:hypothetical protein